MYGIIRSMSHAGTPTDNAAIEAINGWIKAEIFKGFHITGETSVTDEIDRYIRFFNDERPAYSLCYLTPKQYKELRFSSVWARILCRESHFTMSERRDSLVGQVRRSCNMHLPHLTTIHAARGLLSSGPWNKYPFVLSNFLIFCVQFFLTSALGCI